MIKTVWTCDWCKSNGDGANWIQRKGQVPVMFRDNVADQKYLVPSEERDLHFCKDACNQSHKQAAAKADEESRIAWIKEYSKYGA